MDNKPLVFLSLKENLEVGYMAQQSILIIGARTAKILVENDKAMGVRLVDGS
jgi:hypothetical protein